MLSEYKLEIIFKFWSDLTSVGLYYGNCKKLLSGDLTIRPNRLIWKGTHHFRFELDNKILRYTMVVIISVFRDHRKNEKYLFCQQKVIQKVTYNSFGKCQKWT